MDKNRNMEWDVPVPAFDYAAEMKKIRKSLRKRNFFIVLTSLVLAAALAFGCIQYGIPALEKQYWDPNTSTYVDGVTDLHLTMATYNELFSYGQHFMSVNAIKTGFAQYNLEFGFVNHKTLNHLTDISYRSATLNKGELTFPTEFWYQSQDVRPLTNGSYRKGLVSDHNARTRKKLNQFPGYVELQATITFSEDITMEQLYDLTAELNFETARPLWAYIRTSAPEDGYTTPCGIHLQDYNSEPYKPHLWWNTDYPALFYSYLTANGKVLEQHFTSMLKFSRDQLAKGTGVVPPNGDENFYQNVLDYVEKNGVTAYGMTIIATPKVLYELMKKDIVYCLWLSDAWIGL